MDSAFAEQILATTRRQYNTIAQSFSDTRKRAYDLSALTADVQSGESVLDVGCGNARLLDALPVGVQYTGCDTSERMIAVAQNRHVLRLPNIQFVMGDILSLPFPPASFDYVFALAVLHHIPSVRLRQQAVRELARVVKPGGRVVITVWNLRTFYWMRRYWLWRLFFGLHEKGYDHGDCFVPWRRSVEKPLLRYVHAFTGYEFRNLLEQEGLRPLQQLRTRNHLIIAQRTP